MHVFIPKFFDTGYIKNRLADCDETSCDFREKLESLAPGECVTLRWTTKNDRKQKDGYLIIARYWVTPWGTRKLRLQCHIIRTDGSIGARRILLERHNGRVVR